MTIDKGYLRNYTEEYFKIKEFLYWRPTVYKLEDYKNEDLEGICYEDELSPLYIKKFCQTEM